MNTEKKLDEDKNLQSKKEKKPNELSDLYFSSFVKIVDKNSGEVLLQTRCN